MADLIDTIEMYLRTIFELEEEGVAPLRARIANRLNHSGPTVSQTVARMERDGLLKVSDERLLELTEEGRLKAVRVMRKHRLAECLLVGVIKLPLDLVHVEACRWEHVISPEVERRIYAMVGKPEFSPFGNRIPGLDDLGVGTERHPNNGEESLVQLIERGAKLVTLTRIDEVLQSEHAVLIEILAADIAPGSVLTLNGTTSGLIEILHGTHSVRINKSDALHIFAKLRNK